MPPPGLEAPIILVAMRGKRSLAPAAGFFSQWELECVNLHEELENGSYLSGAYRYFKIYEPKERIVAAAPFRDRVVHHALVSVMEPLFEPRFLEDSFACRKGKGTHAGMRRALHHARRHPYALKCDLKRYFPSIDHGILTGEIARVVADRRVMDLIAKILASHRDGIRREWSVDDLFDFTDHPRGLPIGNLTSQFFANIHLDRFDHFVKQGLRVPGYVRYVDDFILFGPDRAMLHRWGRQCREFLAARKMELHPDKYQLCRTAEGVDFCGFVVRADGRVKLRSSGVRRFRRRYVKLKHDWLAGRCEAADLRDAVRSWIAHARHAQTWRLRGKVLGPWSAPWTPGINATWFVARAAGRFVEQQLQQPARVQPQQQHVHEREQQRGVPRRQAPGPHPGLKRPDPQGCCKALAAVPSRGPARRSRADFRLTAETRSNKPKCRRRLVACERGGRPSPVHGAGD